MTKFGKVWGETSPILQNPIVEFHRIEAKAGYKCSTHRHKHKWNGFFVEQGTLVIAVYKNNYNLVDYTTLGPGDFTMVPPGEYHYFQVEEETVAFEIYWPELLSEDIERKDVGGSVGLTDIGGV